MMIISPGSKVHVGYCHHFVSVIVCLLHELITFMTSSLKILTGTDDGSQGSTHRAVQYIPRWKIGRRVRLYYRKSGRGSQWGHDWRVSCSLHIKEPSFFRFKTRVPVDTFVPTRKDLNSIVKFLSGIFQQIRCSSYCFKDRRGQQAPMPKFWIYILSLIQIGFSSLYSL